MLEGKKTKVGAIGFGISAVFFALSLLEVPIVLAYSSFCISMMFTVWGLYDRLVKIHGESQEVRGKSVEAIDKAFFRVTAKGKKVPVAGGRIQGGD